MFQGRGQSGPKSRPTLIACSHRRHVQDKTVFSCPCRRCEENWQQDKTVLSCLDPVSNLIGTIQSQIYWGLLITWKLETGRDKTKLFLVLSPIVFTPTAWTTQDSFVLSVSAVWTSCNWRCLVCVHFVHLAPQGNPTRPAYGASWLIINNKFSYF